MDGRSALMFIVFPLKVEHNRPSNPIFPLRRYFLASFYTKYDTTHFVVNTVLAAERADPQAAAAPRRPNLRHQQVLTRERWTALCLTQRRFSSPPPHPPPLLSGTDAWTERFCIVRVDVTAGYGLGWKVRSLKGEETNVGCSRCVGDDGMPYALLT